MMMDMPYRSRSTMFHYVVDIVNDNLGGRIPIAVGMLEELIGRIKHRRRRWGYFIVAAVNSTSKGGDLERRGRCIPHSSYAMKHGVSQYVNQPLNRLMSSTTGY